MYFRQAQAQKYLIGDCINCTHPFYFKMSQGTGYCENCDTTYILTGFRKKVHSDLSDYDSDWILQVQAD